MSSHEPASRAGAASAYRGAARGVGGGRLLRVVHVVRTLKMGGQEVMICRLVERLAPERFSCSVVVLQGHDEQDGPLWRGLRDRGIPVYPMLAPREGASLALLPALGRKFFELGADVVHAHNLQPLFYAGIASLVKPGAALVSTAHGYVNWDGFRYEAPLRALLRRAVIVAVSPELQEFLAQRGWARDRLELIVNGVDVDALTRVEDTGARRAALGVAPGAWVVGALGRLSPEKDHANLIRATAIVAQREPRTELLLAGDGPIRGELEELARELGVDGRVRFLGQVTGPEVQAFLGVLDVYCLPSRTEGTSVSLLEAMSCKVPVVATSVGGTPSALDMGSAGRLVPPNDAAALADALLSARADPEAGFRMAERGRAIVEERFSLRRMVDRYADLYARVSGA
jgi:glycosyltransferase involved in cell wall biosynthesis